MFPSLFPTFAFRKCIFPYEKDGELFYYTGKKKPTRFPFKELRYFAPYIKGKGIREYYEIIGYDFIKRNEIFPEDHDLYSRDDSERLVIKLGKCNIIGVEGEYYKVKMGRSGYSYTNLKSLRAYKEHTMDKTTNKKQ